VFANRRAIFSRAPARSIHARFDVDVTIDTQY
jgi:hypothetical protein